MSLAVRNTSTAVTYTQRRAAVSSGGCQLLRPLLRPQTRSRRSPTVKTRSVHTEHNWSLQQRQGHRWIEGLLWEQELPHIDWTRYHIQLLFVDESHQLRARLAEGLTNKIAEWNGYGRALYADSCGVGAAADAHLGMSEAATLMAEGARFRIDTHIVRAPRARFSPELLDHYDLILAMDDRTVEGMLSTVEDPEDRAYYMRKIRRVDQFASYLPQDRLLHEGAGSFLETRVRALLTAGMVEGRSDGAEAPGESAGILPSVHDPSEWRSTVSRLIQSCSGLVAYLIDAYPEGLDQQWLD